MKKVCITGLRPRAASGEEYYQFFLKLARENPGPFQIVDDYREADYILLIYGTDDIFGLSEQEKEMIRTRSESIYTFNGSDRPATYFPGVYSNLTKDMDLWGRMRSFCFPFVNPYLEDVLAKNIKPDLLFSFAGGSTSWLRKKIYKINYNRSDILIQDTSYHQEWNPSQQEWIDNKYRFGETLARSRFVLCPRGASISAGRFFESMQVGRPPVFLADAFVFPKGPAWEKFSIIIPEKDLLRVPEILESYKGRADEMGKIAREEWLRWFAPTVWFNRIMENVLDIEANKKISEKNYQFCWPIIRASRWMTWNSRLAAKQIVVRGLELTGLRKKLSLNR